MAQSFWQKYQLLIGLVVSAIMLISVYAVLNMTQEPASVIEGKYEVTAKWNIYVSDLLNEGAAVGSGTIAIYEIDNPGFAIESSLSVSSGKATTAKEYTSGKQLFIKYTDTTYFDYGMVINIPKVKQEYTSQSTLDLPTTMYVIKMADCLQGASNTDVFILDTGAAAWDDSAAATSAFNRTADGDYPVLGIRIANEDVETAYVDPRGYIDYSTQDELTRDKKSYLVVEFQPTGTTTTALDVGDFLKFSSLPSGTITKDMANSLVLFYPLDDSDCDAMYVYNVDDESNPIGDADGSGIIFEPKFDFSGSISTAIGADDIDIEVSFLTGFSMAWFDAKLRLSSIPGDDPLGEIATVWTNDVSIGW